MIRKPLGRGLDALIDGGGNHAGADGAPVYLLVAPAQIVASPLQPRRHFDVEKLLELTNAIRTQGIIEPLIVRPLPGGLEDRYELIAGERRLRAARAAGLEVVPVLVRELNDRAALEMSLVENLVREDLNAVEEARAFVRLNNEFDLSHEQIASRIGKSRPYVTNTMRLLELPLPVVEMIARGGLAPGQARPLLSMRSADEQMAAATRIAEGKVTARAAEQMVVESRPAVRNDVSRLVAERGAKPDANLSALAESMQKALKRKVRLIPGHGKAAGRVELEYYDDDDLTGLSRLLITAGTAWNNG